jgi:hypothetical protein
MAEDSNEQLLREILRSMGEYSNGPIGDQGTAGLGPVNIPPFLHQEYLNMSLEGLSGWLSVSFQE